MLAISTFTYLLFHLTKYYLAYTKLLVIFSGYGKYIKTHFLPLDLRVQILKSERCF